VLCACACAHVFVRVFVCVCAFVAHALSHVCARARTRRHTHKHTHHTHMQVELMQAPERDVLSFLDATEDGAAKKAELQVIVLPYKGMQLVLLRLISLCMMM
jgi:hypothetical protein